MLAVKQKQDEGRFGHRVNSGGLGALVEKADA